MRSCCVLIAVFGLLVCAAHAGPLFRTNNIFPLQDKHVHGSSVVECPNGDLLACWYHGSGERTADDVQILGARLRKGAAEWSPIFPMADTPGFPDCNPVMFIDAKQRLWLFWIAVQANRWEYSLLKYRRADDYQDDGPPRWSWQDVIMMNPGEAFAETMKKKFEEARVPERVWAEYAPPYTRVLIQAAQDPYKRVTGWMTRIHPITLPSGRILLPLYSDGFKISLVAISDDAGETWRPSLPIIGMGPIQPTIARKKDGTLVAYMRDRGDLPARVQMSTSGDNGESWSYAVDTDIPNPSSSLEVVVLQDGRWLMVCNDTEDDRYRLTALLSDDEGATWKWRRSLEASESKDRSFSYPSVVQMRDGLIHMTYSYSVPGTGASIRHCTINTEWLTSNN